MSNNVFPFSSHKSSNLSKEQQQVLIVEQGEKSCFCVASAAMAVMDDLSKDVTSFDVAVSFSSVEDVVSAVLDSAEDEQQCWQWQQPSMCSLCMALRTMLF